ncbi:MAG: hypothetical protein EXQ94_13625 [Alphaproteobacteria bacterium]|nr:hypothetical protein [Alphaproteobacteria bacterium]
MATQRAAIFDGPGDPAEVLRLAEVPVPAPGPGQVAIRMLLRPVNPADLLFVSGRYGGKPAYPAMPGMEGMGRVLAAGAGVSGFAPGDRVVPLGARAT